MDFWDNFSEKIIGFLLHCGFSESQVSHRSYFFIDEKKKPENKGIVGIIWNIQSHLDTKHVESAVMSQFKHKNLHLFSIHLNKSSIHVGLLSKSKKTDIISLEYNLAEGNEKKINNSLHESLKSDRHLQDIFSLLKIYMDVEYQQRFFFSLLKFTLYISHSEETYDSTDIRDIFGMGSFFYQIGISNLKKEYDANSIEFNSIYSIWKGQ